MSALTIAAVGTGLVAWQLLHLAIVIAWSDAQTRGARYYALPLQQRRRFRRRIQLHALLLSPVLKLLAMATRARFSQRRFLHAGVAGPLGACSPESFRQAAMYEPDRDDVFVVTQMRSGTTWMQHLVYQVLTHGAGDLVSGGAALGAVSPWLESLRTIGVREAPLVGFDRPARIIKTHLPASLCPFNGQAKYIYVVRHPLACFASCGDFVRNNLAGFAPPWDELAAWFQSDDLMWWGTWVTHVAGWQRLATREANVLLVRYEEMASDLAAVVQRLAAFLGVPPLTEAELASIVAKCRLDYMRNHADAFEMHPPHLLQADNPFFRQGGSDRCRDVPHQIARRILDWCRAQGTARGAALGRLYPDLAVPPQPASPAPRHDPPELEGSHGDVAGSAASNSLRNFAAGPIASIGLEVRRDFP